MPAYCRVTYSPMSIVSAIVEEGAVVAFRIASRLFAGLLADYVRAIRSAGEDKHALQDLDAGFECGCGDGGTQEVPSPT